MPPYVHKRARSVSLCRRLLHSYCFTPRYKLRGGVYLPVVRITHVHRTSLSHVPATNYSQRETPRDADRRAERDGALFLPPPASLFQTAPSPSTGRPAAKTPTSPLHKCTARRLIYTHNSHIHTRFFHFFLFPSLSRLLISHHYTRNFYLTQIYDVQYYSCKCTFKLSLHQIKSRQIVFVYHWTSNRQIN